MPWWCVSSVLYWPVYSDVFFQFLFPISLSPFCSTGENVFLSELALAGWSWALLFFLGIGVYASKTDGIWVKAVWFFQALLKASSLPWSSVLTPASPWGPMLWACSFGDSQVGSDSSVVSRVVAVSVPEDPEPGTSSLHWVFAVAMQQAAYWMS